MKFRYYLNEKALVLLLNLILMFLLYIFFSPMRNSKLLILSACGLWTAALSSFIIVSYKIEKRKTEEIINLVDSLEEKYFIADIIDKPVKLSDYGYYYALKKACKSMNDRVSSVELQNKQFTDYINMLIHEIKTPVSAISLVCNNNSMNNYKNNTSMKYSSENTSMKYSSENTSTKYCSVDNSANTSVNISVNDDVNKNIINQLTIIENYLEQVLYYTRMEHTENDYFVADINLSDVVHSSIINFKDAFLNQKIDIIIGNLDYNIKSDEKWLSFIINQIIQNSIKYFDKDKKELCIDAYKIDNKIELSIKDNGCGIDLADMPRIFDYGFTGSNRQKKYSTGMGLYICQKLCDKLGLTITVESQKSEYTLVKIRI